MHKEDVKKASKHLSELVKEASLGEKVIITQSDGTAVKLMPENVDKALPKFGSAKGQIWLSDDFDEPLESFKEYTPST